MSIATHVTPWYTQSKVAQIAFFDVDRQPKLVESLFAELQILESHITAEDTDIELAGVQVLDISLEETVQ